MFSMSAEALCLILRLCYKQRRTCLSFCCKDQMNWCSAAPSMRFSTVAGTLLFFFKFGLKHFSYFADRFFFEVCSAFEFFSCKVENTSCRITTHAFQFID